MNTLTALSPLDGRYQSKTAALGPICSEYGLIYFRTYVEIRWLLCLSEAEGIPEVAPLSPEDRETLLTILEKFNEEDAAHIKAIERDTNHDLKAVEYFLREHFLTQPNLKKLSPFIHFGCTSEDINNLAYALMLKTARDEVILPVMTQLVNTLSQFVEREAGTPMLARTHGQPASPTTLGKEFANYTARLTRQLGQFKNQAIFGKLNGAVGNFNAHHVAYPNVDWLALSQLFVENLGLHYNAYTTQIEPHDFIAEIFQTFSRFNTIVIDFNRDIWSYISINYFGQQVVKGEVGSSTMPHKVNPIDFENSEGNLGLANALAHHLSQKLPISRFQRDLTDSTVLRNIGSIFGYALIAYQATLKGLGKLIPNKNVMQADLDSHWEVLGEAIQTVMRKHGITDAYEQLKLFTRGQKIDQQMIIAFIDSLTLPQAVKAELTLLTPASYLGYAKKMSKLKS